MGHAEACPAASRLRTDGVGAAGNGFRQIEEKSTPWHFWEDKSRLTGMPKKVPLSKNLKIAVTPLVLTPFAPLRASRSYVSPASSSCHEARSFKNSNANDNDNNNNNNNIIIINKINKNS